MRNAKRLTERFGVLALSLLLAAASTAEGGAPRENLAAGKPYSVRPQPNYAHCTDPGDATDLTDGTSTAEYFWTQKGTVGWRSAPFAAITVDLGDILPIGGAALTTAAGVAGVTWPLSIPILVSDDGTEYRLAGDLVTADRLEAGPLPTGYAIRKLATENLATRGRFVQFVLIPAAGAPYLFTDEVEVLRGPDAFLDTPPEGERITDVRVLVESGRVARAVRRRVDATAAGIAAAVSKADIPDAAKGDLLARIEAVRAEAVTDPVETDGFRAILPVCPAEQRLFALQAEGWRRTGLSAARVQIPPVWDPSDPFTRESPDTGEIRVELMRGEFRAAALDIRHPGPETATARVRIDGLPQAVLQAIEVRTVAWTDTSEGTPVAAALTDPTPGTGEHRAEVHPGLVRQLWLTVGSRDIPPGAHAGTVVVDTGSGPPARIPVRVTVHPAQFPERTTLLVGGWGYTNGNGRYGVTPANRDALIRHLRERHVNAPWATSSVLFSVSFPPNEPGEVRLDTTEFDDWVAHWPAAEEYYVFLSVPESFGGAPLGTPEFDRRVASWITAWAVHLRKLGIEPGRLGLLLRDEPHEGTDVRPIVEWARAIRAAAPEVRIWEDPTYENPAAAPAELFEAADVLCPNRPMWLRLGKPFAATYRSYRDAGKELQFYSCSGPAKLLDPYSYHRLQAWQCLAEGATGSFFWAFGDNGGAPSFNEYLASAGPYTPVFLSATEVIPGKHMEAIRESVQDYETFILLSRALQEPAAGVSEEVRREARLLLGEGPETVLEAEGAAAIRWHEPKDRTMADGVRIRALRLLTRLRGEAPPGP